MRYTEFNKDKYFRVTNFGVLGSPIFQDKEDYARFLFLILYLQSPTVLNNANWYVQSFLKKGKFNVGPEITESILEERQVELVSFYLETTGFSLIVKNLDDSILSVYMQRVLTGYARYFNSKYHRRGHLFEGPFQAAEIKRHDLKKATLENHKKSYGSGYSSLIDYKNKEGRWGRLLTIVNT